MFDPFGIKRRRNERIQLVTVLHLLTNQVFQIHERVLKMNQTIQDLITAVAAERSAVASAVVLMNGITDRVTAAVAAALEANPGIDLSPLIDLTSQIKQDTEALSTAVATDSVQSADPAASAPVAQVSSGAAVDPTAPAAPAETPAT